MADTPELTEAQRNSMVQAMLCELARQASHAANVTQDPRIRAIAAVAQDQVKNTAAFEELLAGYGRASSSADNAVPVSTVNAVFQQAQAASVQQNERWNQILAVQLESNTQIETEIRNLTLNALHSLAERKQHERRTGSSPDPSAGAPGASPAPAAAAVPTGDSTVSL